MTGRAGIPRSLHIELGRHRFGGTMQCHYLSRELVRRGGAAAVVTPRGSPLAELSRAAGVPLFEIDSFGDLDLRLVTTIRRLVRDFAPEITHIHSRRGADTLGLLGARWGRCGKVIVSRRVDDPLPANWLNRLRYDRLPDRVIAVSWGIVRELERAGIPGTRISQVYSAIDLASYRVAADRDAVRGELGLADASQVIAVIAQLIERKGHRYLLQALPQILARHPGARLLCLGEGGQRTAIEAEIARLDLGDKVVLAGYRDDVGRLLNAIDLLVHPATMEGFANVALQAFAVGIPVVSTAVGGMPESVRDGICGVLVAPRDPDALARAVADLLDDPERMRRYGAAGRELVEREFTIERMVERTLAVYRRLLADHA